ncbi:MAG: peptidylprolyl isomerase [Gemmatimonadota bacterium]
MSERLDVIFASAAIGASRRLAAIPRCDNIITAAEHDPHPWVRLIAVDSLGAACADSMAARAALTRLVDQSRGDNGAHTWQVPARALEALAHVDPLAVNSRITRYATAGRWEERAAAARAATTIVNDALLYALARDQDQNVREAAMLGLARNRKHEADSVFLAGLAAPGYQVVLGAANALAGTTSELALPALLDNLDRLTQQQSENARDPRLAMLRRIGELGSAGTAARLRPYLSDFDTTVAATAAGFLTRWEGATVVAHAQPLPVPVEPLAQLFLSRGIRLRVTLTQASGGGSFTMLLHTDEAPATAARLIRLARAGFYNGGIWQRVEPNFVVQGGGPGATEYIGDRTFLRDELLWHTHFRGTVGISARGRDTGDAQLYINVVDNPLLDHEYTVAGTIIAGRDVTERILEGDAIARVEVIGAP